MLIHQITNSEGSHSYNCRYYHNIHWPFHFHKNFEVIYVESGNVCCTIGGKTTVLKAGNFGFCLSNEIHAYQTVGESTSWVVVFSGDFIPAFEKRTMNKVGSDFLFHCRQETIAYLKAVLFCPGEPSLYTLKSCFYALCSEYCDVITLTERTAKNDHIMQDITEFIWANHQRDISLTDIAETLGYDYFYISKRFHKIFNMSFKEFLNSYRLETALQLLTETDKSITVVADESGFQSIRSFNHYFKTRTGLTPAQYRNQTLVTAKRQIIPNEN